MQKSESLNEIAKEVKKLDDGLNETVLNILQDSVKDKTKIISKLTIIIIILLIVIGFAMFLIYRQNIKYQEFLSQFDFGTNVEAIQETDDNSSINDGIKIDR